MIKKPKETKFKQELFKAKTEAVILALVCGANVTLTKNSIKFVVPVKNDRDVLSFNIDVSEDSLMNQMQEVNKARKTILLSLNCVNPVRFESFAGAYKHVMKNFVTGDLLVERAFIKNALKNFMEIRNFYCSYNSSATYENRQYLMALVQIYAKIEEITKRSHITIQRLDEIIDDISIMQGSYEPPLVGLQFKKNNYEFKVENSHKFSPEDFSLLN